MKPQSLHAQEDRLLDFAYGELPPHEAHVVESHIEGCPRCSELLADIRGVRTTMAKLPMEPAPEAGLESLLAYAQQAARNAAEGPAPKPTWWRRWLVPLVGATAVCLFGVLATQVSKTVDSRPQLVAKSESVRDEAPAYGEKAPVPSAAMAVAPAPVAQEVPTAAPASPVANAEPQKLQEQDSAAMALSTPPSSTEEGALEAKEAPRKSKKPFMSGTKAPSANWGNAGAGSGFERAKDAENELAAAKKATDKKADSYDYNQRDAMTQVGALTKSRTMGNGPAQGDTFAQQPLPEPSATPAPVAAQPAEEKAAAGSDGIQPEAYAQQQAPTQSSSLRLNESRSRGTAPANKPAADVSQDDFDDLFGAKKSVAKREQQAPGAAAMPPPPPPPSAAAPRPSTPSVSSAGSGISTGRAAPKGGTVGPTSAELSKLADAAFRSGARVREAQYLAQALEAGASGSERLGLLNRLCDAQFAIGQRQAAIQTCQAVLDEGPRSGAAQLARGRLKREAPETDDARASPGSRAAKKAAPAETESAAPASAPAQVQ
jgi:anti-sigma factor RsiW